MHQINIYLLILIMYNYLHPITNGKIEVKFVQELDTNLTLVQNDLCFRYQRSKGHAKGLDMVNILPPII
jgi:hypothetical protein